MPAVQTRLTRNKLRGTLVVGMAPLASGGELQWYPCVHTRLFYASDRLVWYHAMIPHDKLTVQPRISC